ncbi:MAG: 4-oxalocrotonate tautomerase family protein [Candidatus Geothermarchaeales archaeon]
MPVIEVKTWEGKSDEEKAKIIRGITDVFEGIGVPPEAVTVIIQDIPKKNWGKEGRPCA